MYSAKEITLRPISAKDGNDCIRRLHYNGKVAQNSQIHIGVFLNGRLEGAMQFGPSIDKRKTQRLVDDTPWNGFVELNRMAFGPALPRNSESRALAVAMRLLRKHKPSLQWVVSFADGTQCGDGAIYRASGFVLTGIKKNTQMLRLANGEIVARKTLDNPNNTGRDGRFGSAIAIESGAVPLSGYQLRYIYFLNRAARQRLTVPVIPFSEIERRGAGMYKGKPRAGSADGGTSGTQPEGDGSNPIPALSQ